MKKNKEVKNNENIEVKENAIIVKETRLEKTGNIAAVKEQVENIYKLYSEVMKESIDYGNIPGVNKPTLFKSGAEKIAFMFRLVPEFQVQEKWLENGHLTCIVKCELWTHEKSAKLGEGVGMCSSLESKYRYRNAERVCPQCGKNSIIKGKAEYGGGWICYKNKGGCGAKYKDDDSQITNQVIGKIESENIADVYNTILKMAKKRAYVDAILTVTGVSDIFTQDLEEIKEEEAKMETVNNSNIEKAKKLLNEWYNLEAQAGISGSKYEFLEFVFGKVGSCDLSRKKSLKELSEQELKELIKIAKIEIKELKEVKK